MGNMFEELEQRFGDVFQEWHIVRKLEQKGDEDLYEVQNITGPIRPSEVLTHISIPRDEQELQQICREFGDADGSVIRDYLYHELQQYQDGYDAYMSLIGYTNILAVEDFRILEKKDMPGYDVFIRTERLKDLRELAASETFSGAEITQLGRDICKALEILEEHQIKGGKLGPDTIFRGHYGDYKLGEISINAKNRISRFMAPECFLGKETGLYSDIYALGMVMYWLANEKRLPFLDLQAITMAQRDEALRRRLEGEKLPAPSKAEPSLAQIILKACAYDPEERYQHPGEMRKDLERLTQPDGEDTIRPEAYQNYVPKTGGSLMQDIDLGGESFETHNEHGHGGGGFTTRYIASERKAVHETWVYTPPEYSYKKTEELAVPKRITTEKELRDFINKHCISWLKN